MNDLFYMPRKDRLAYLCLIITVLMGSMILSAYDRINLRDYHQSIIHVEKEQVVKKAIKQKYKPSLTPFNPNKVGREQLQRYGFSEYSANNLIKYRNKGGHIKSVDQLYSIYGIDTSLVKSIAHLIHLPTPKTKAKRQTKIKAIYAKKPPKKVVKEPSYTLVHFNPNTADSTSLRSLGLSRYATKNLLRYRQKGGMIKNDSDLSKIYGIDSLTFSRLLPYITLEKDTLLQSSSQDKFEYVIEDKPIEEPVVIDINSATQEQLQSLNGIGPFFSKAIIEYKNRLGGYHTLDQLLEIYNFRSGLLDTLRPYLTVQGKVDQFYIPATSYKKAVSHPYMDKNVVRQMKRCPINTCDSLLQALITDGSIDSRALPYLITKNTYLKHD